MCGKGKPLLTIRPVRYCQFTGRGDGTPLHKPALH
nr:MAG TPA: hypothetical protein [Caudoviricetes sp.]